LDVDSGIEIRDQNMISASTQGISTKMAYVVIIKKPKHSIGG
jgi:hypothetical protein